MVEHLYTYIDPPAERHLEKAIKILENDGVVVLPTASNWAFCCDARNVKAIDRIHRLKPSHDELQPFSFICSSISMAADVGNIDNHIYRFLKKAWPGPFTIIVKSNRSLPRQIKDKRQTVGIRIPKSPLVLALIDKFGHPLATTSVPLKPDGTPFHMGYEIAEFFGHGFDLLMDLGDELLGSESTVIDFTAEDPRLVREGAGDPALFGL